MPLRRHSQRTHHGRLRTAALAGTAGVAMTLASALTATSAFGDETVLVMGGSGIPAPPEQYIDSINGTYFDCDAGCTVEALTTPEGFWPITGINDLTLDESLAQGVEILDDAIKEQLAAGNDVTVFGYSQSASIASLEMQAIANGSAGIEAEPD